MESALLKCLKFEQCMRRYHDRFRRAVPLRGLLIALLLVATSLACNGQRTSGDTPDQPPGGTIQGMKLPAGFQITMFADHVPGARSMVLSPGNILFVGTREGSVYAIPDANNGADKVLTIASGLNEPNGVAFYGGALYVAEINRVIKYDSAESRLTHLSDPVVVNDHFPSDALHGWKFIRIGPDNKLYVPIGAPCNICEMPDPYASIMRMNPDGSNLEMYAKGIRNTVGFDWDPRTKELWFTDNGRDMLGDDTPPDELNHATAAGQNFGFPYCHGGTIPDPEFGSKHPCSDFVAPAINLGPHVAALGMRFYNGTMFPEQYRNQIFIAEHGSWNRSTKIGYRITLVRLNNNSAVSYETFAEGWLHGGRVSGRPVDVLVMPDGSLLVSDDMAGAIYRITYQ